MCDRLAGLRIGTALSLSVSGKQHEQTHGWMCVVGCDRLVGFSHAASTTCMPAYRRQIHVQGSVVPAGHTNISRWRR